MDLLGQTLDMPFISSKDLDFLAYFKGIVKKRYTSKGNYDNWLSTYNYLEDYTKGQCVMSQVDEAFCEGFKDYLDSCYTKKSSAYKLSANSKYSYFNKFRAAIKQGMEDKHLHHNPILRIKAFPQGESFREFLTLDEVKKLKSVRCDNPVLEKAAFWSIRTGMRWGDCLKLKWIDIQYSEDQGYFVRFNQNKTKSYETLPVTEEAVKELKKTVVDLQEYVFKGLTYSSHNNFLLAKWAMNAGINKHITFHCFRHTNATLLISAGEDIYTVSKMLGHKELRTTEIYAKVLNSKKVEAANRIKF
jgi:integrase